ncbi:DUF4345 domain-containing protein [Plantactinospora endophytica]|uniref:DUF4345 domain-containing protein n=1 Tax=Plantactinospora endophytica TaxID=673535 RepID=A0ABQ4EEY3_9ACTN|nr:DUF4345 domain-containing protein [Plantactinospora endophytica]GIG93283.1 hypothetical protein Pen02_82190 [Plantactinospora endophytica]
MVLGLLATVAVASGLAGMLVGPAALPGAGPVDATVDSGFRYANAFWFAAGAVAWWAVPRVERATAPLRLVLGAVILGGIARLLAALASGWPHPVYLGALAVELVLVPLVLVWQAEVAQAARRAAG